MLDDGIDFAFGGKVANNFLVCGGLNDSSGSSKECYKVGETTPLLELPQPRDKGASVVLQNDSLLITGESSYSICSYFGHLPF